MKKQTFRSFENSAKIISQNSEDSDVESAAWELLQRWPDLSAARCVSLARKAIRRKTQQQSVSV